MNHSFDIMCWIEHYANVNYRQIQELKLAYLHPLGMVVTIWSIKNIHNICRRQKRTKVPSHSTLPDEISLRKRGMNETQNETLLFNDELNPSPLYTEIAANNECENVRVCI